MPFFLRIRFDDGTRFRPSFLEKEWSSSLSTLAPKATLSFLPEKHFFLQRKGKSYVLTTEACSIKKEEENVVRLPTISLFQKILAALSAVIFFADLLFRFLPSRSCRARKNDWVHRLPDSFFPVSRTIRFLFFSSLSPFPNKESLIVLLSYTERFCEARFFL
jgi:hypothetical protein